ncbi:MAG TPA: TonB-dependent receptor [Candidatus Synoicihabitans sp.]|nr:TonB-dependent receptor [Candidatus Synoicihabitans sp.]
MHFSHFAPAILSLLAAVSVRAQTSSAPSDPASSGDGPAFVLGRYEVNASSVGLRAADLLTSVTLVGADQLHSEGVDYSLEVLNKVPGLTLTDFNQGVITADVSIRGFNAEGSMPHLRLLVDGIPHNLNSGYNDLGAIFPLEMQSIEAVKGTLDPRFGFNAIAGAIQVFTRREITGAQVKIMAGDYGTIEGQALAGFRTGGFSQTYFAGYRESDGYRDHAKLNKHSFSGKWFYSRAEERWRVGLIARTHAFESEAPGYLTRDAARENPRASAFYSSSDGGEQENDQFSVHADGQITEDLQASLKLYHHEVLRNRFVRFSATAAQQERVEDETHRGVIASATWKTRQLAFPLTLEGGLERHEQDVINQRFRTIDRTRQAVTRDHRYDLGNTGGYVGVDARPQDWLRFQGGLRADQFDGEMLDRAANRLVPLIRYGTIWQPKFGASAQVHPTANVYASYGRAFQIGSGAGAYSTQPLDYSKNDGFEAGVHWTPRPELAVRAALWRQTATDEVRLKSDNSGDSENVGETKREGLDLEVSWRAHAFAEIWAAWSVQSAKFVEPGPTQPQLRGKELDHVPDQMVKFGVDSRFTEAFSTSVWLYGQDASYLTPDNQTGRFGGYVTLNADLRYEWKRATFGVHVKNVTDEYYEYVWHDGAQTLHSPADGRTFLATVAFEF